MAQHGVQPRRGRHRSHFLDIFGHVARALLQGINDASDGQHAPQPLAVQHWRVVVLARLQQLQGMVRSGTHGQRQPCPLLQRMASIEHLAAVHVLQEGLHVLGGRFQQDVLGLSLLHQLAVLQDGNAVAQAQRLVQVVGDEDDGLVEPGLQLQQVVLHLAAYQRIQRREGLVHQQDLGIGGQRAGQPHPLLHAAGELMRILVLETRQPHLVQPVTGLFLTLGTWHLLHGQSIGGVVQHGAVRKEPEALEDHAHLLLTQVGQLSPPQLHHVLAIHPDLARGGLDETVEVPDERGFARTRQAHDDVDAAFVDGQGDVAQAQRMTTAGQQLLLAHAILDNLQPAIGMRAEDLVDVADFDLAHQCAPRRCRRP